MTRHECVICGCKRLTSLIDIDHVPIYMGTTKKNDVSFMDMKYVTCDDCGCIQLKHLVDPTILYADNHNKSVVGATWETHNKEFVQFINDRTDPYYVLEIGDPSYKMVTASRGIMPFKRWNIVEPNPPEEYPEDVEYVAGIFGRDYNTDNFVDIDTVVLSHSLEHMYHPKEILDAIYRATDHNVSMYISIPDFDYITHNHMMPPGGMHFEHTYYASVHNITMLLNRCGFTITSQYNYNNHSVFLECKKINRINELRKYDFKHAIYTYKHKVRLYNAKIREHEGPVFLYGAHYPAQLMLSLGLSRERINGILDNDPLKQNNLLYGTELMVHEVEFLDGVDNALVICEMGPYTEEITNNILSINPKVKICELE